jgi:hypothetical protein
VEVDSKFTAQLCALLNRDVVDPITRELEQNALVKSAIDEIKQGISAGGDKLDAILSRRRQLLASAVCALVGHQSNYHARLGAQYAPLQPHVQTNKAALSNMQVNPGKPATPDHVELRSAAAPAEVRKPEPEQPKPQEAPPAKPSPAPQPAKQAEADLLNFGGATNSTSQAAPEPKSAEADLLGGFGIGTPTAASKPSPAPERKAEANLLDGLDSSSGDAAPPQAKQPEADLLGGFFETPAPAKPKAPQNDLLAGFTPTTASSKSSAPNNDPFGDWMGSGSSAKAQPAKQQDNFLNMFDPMGSGGSRGGAGGSNAAPRVNGDDEGNNSPSTPSQGVARRKPAINSFSGTGTDREALKQQFNEHVQRKVLLASPSCAQSAACKARA